LSEVEIEVRFYDEIAARLGIAESEYPRFVILYDIDDVQRTRPIWVNFSTGYRLE
jgi:hypothetical protein